MCNIRKLQLTREIVFRIEFGNHEKRPPEAFTSNSAETNTSTLFFKKNTSFKHAPAPHSIFQNPCSIIMHKQKFGFRTKDDKVVSLHARYF